MSINRQSSLPVNAVLQSV